MREYEYIDINRRDYERRMYERVNPTLMENFNKVADWVAKNCPKLNGKFNCSFNSFYWIALVVEDGKAYLEYGSHGYGFDVALSRDETATFSRGSCQKLPHAFKGVQFARNDRLEQFLSEWQGIKSAVIAKNNMQQNVYSEGFVA